jgi:tripartite-type tricarboxylate transporter receptor subunit TctC
LSTPNFGDPATLGIINGGKARAMAMTSSERWPPLSDAPTLGALLAAVAVRKVMADPAVAKKCDDNGLHPATLSRGDHLAFVRKDSAVWGKVIGTGNIKADE